MPPKDISGTNGVLYIGLNNGKYVRLATTEAIDITPINPSDDFEEIRRAFRNMDAHFTTSKLPEHLFIALLTGNDFYIKFPKKARRKLKRMRKCK